MAGVPVSGGLVAATTPPEATGLAMGVGTAGPPAIGNATFTGVMAAAGTVVVVAGTTVVSTGVVSLVTSS